MKNKYLFQSARLGFRTWQEKDLLPMAALNADPAVMEFFPSTQSLEDTRAFVKRVHTHFKEYGFGWYAVDLLDNQEFIGFIGMAWNKMEADFTPCAEIGWRLKKAAWGKGYATEGAKRCIAYGFTDLQFKEIYSFTATINKRSERVMQKIGMQKVGIFEHPKIAMGDVLRPHVLYRIASSEKIDIPHAKDEENAK